MSYLIYDMDVNRTVGVVRGDDMDPSVLGEDPLSAADTDEALRLGHCLKVQALPGGTYDKALEIFKGYSRCEEKFDPMSYTFQHHIGPKDAVLSLETHKEKSKRLAQEEKSLKKTGRKYRTDKLPDDIRVKVVDLHNWGHNNPEIAEKLDISRSSVKSIIRTQRNEMGGLNPEKLSFAGQ